MWTSINGSLNGILRTFKDVPSPSSVIFWPWFILSISCSCTLPVVWPSTSCLLLVECCIDLSCLPNRSMEFSLYQETPHPQIQEATPKEPSADPGTLVWSSRTHTYTLHYMSKNTVASRTHIHSDSHSHTDKFIQCDLNSKAKHGNLSRKRLE